jgi:hypothetical protein
VVNLAPGLSAKQLSARAALELKHEKATAASRADRAAKELNLNAGEALQLADCYLAIGQHRRDTLAAMRARQVDHETMKQTVEDLRTWQKDELTRQFGPDIAARIEALDAQSDPDVKLKRGD